MTGRYSGESKIKYIMPPKRDETVVVS